MSLLQKFLRLVRGPQKHKQFLVSFEHGGCSVTRLVLAPSAHAAVSWVDANYGLLLSKQMRCVEVRPLSRRAP